MRHFIALLSAGSFVVLGAAGAVQADMGDQLFKLLADDGAVEDYLGISVAMSGTTALVGAPYDDNENGVDAGSAYLFDTSTGQQIAKILPTGGNGHDWFGGSVAIGGSPGAVIAIVSTNEIDDNGEEAGSAYLFDITDPSNPVQIAKLLPDDADGDDEGFGISVGIDGTTAVVGAQWDDDNGPSSGSAYLFDATTGKQIAKLLANDGAEFDYFGESVGINGATAIIGARTNNDTGAAYVFDVTDPSNPVQIAKLLAEDGAAGDLFGGAVAVSGATAVVGAMWDDDNGESSGSAYLFDTTTGKQLFKLLANDGAEFDRLGESVAINGNTAIIGAAKDNDNGENSGSAYLFDTTTGKQIAKLLSDDGAAEDHFGGSVAISDAIVIVGTAGDDDSGDLAGSAYLFEAACACDDPEVCDCNDNGVPDDCDIANGTSTDCNDNGVPDECEAFEDCNDNGVFDACDIADGISIDCNANGVPDACDLADGTSEDCNRNGVPDECDPDCNANGVPDDCDIADGASFDCDGDGVPDECKSLVGDLNGDGVVGTTDLLVLLSFWGSCDDCDKCYADIDCDCTVGSFDLILLLGNWS